MKKRIPKALIRLLVISLLVFAAACSSAPKFTVTGLYATGVYHGTESDFFRLEDLNVNGTYQDEKMTIPGKQAFMNYEIVSFDGDIGPENAVGGAAITNFRITLKDRDDANAEAFEIVMNAGDSFRILDPAFPVFAFEN